MKQNAKMNKSGFTKNLKYCFSKDTIVKITV